MTHQDTPYYEPQPDTASEAIEEYVLPERSQAFHPELTPHQQSIDRIGRSFTNLIRRVYLNRDGM